MSGQVMLRRELVEAPAAADRVPTKARSLHVANERGAVRPFRAVTVGADPAELEVAIPDMLGKVFDMRDVGTVRAAADTKSATGTDTASPQAERL
jgi:hypothetical protein